MRLESFGLIVEKSFQTKQLNKRDFDVLSAHQATIPQFLTQ
jgi:hypothetical protein